MPLSKPVRRKKHHNRNVMCNGFERDDQLWDIEARMTDIKAYDIDNLERDGYVSAGENYHDMSIRVTMDRRFLIYEVEACIDSSPFRMCPRIADAFRKLEGTRIGPGWLRQAKEKLGGVLGCTHMNELLPVVATTAVQTLWPVSKEDVLETGAKLMLNSCHTWGQSSEMVKTYAPQFYQPESEVNG
jgi:hypothetical protein